MKIVTRKYCDWDDRIKKRLKYATLPGGFLKRFMKAAPDSITLVAFSRKQIMGWVFVFSIGGENFVNIFVNERYRNRGVATCLIKQTLKVFPKITLARWNRVTGKFFTKLEENNPGKIKVIGWRDGAVDRYTKIVECLRKQK